MSFQEPEVIDHRVRGDAYLARDPKANGLGHTPLKHDSLLGLVGLDAVQPFQQRRGEHDLRLEGVLAHCFQVAANRFTDIHFLHGPFEFGMDFIAKGYDGGTFCQFAFQTKAGDLNRPAWDDCRGQINVEFRRSRKARLEKPLSVQSASSNVVDMINCLRRINSQLTSLAYAIVRDSPRSGETSVHSSELEVEEAWPAEDSAKKK